MMPITRRFAVLGLLSVVGLVFSATDSQAFGRKNRGNQNCGGCGGYVTSSYGGCGGYVTSSYGGCGGYVMPTGCGGCGDAHHHHHHHGQVITPGCSTCGGYAAVVGVPGAIPLAMPNPSQSATTDSGVKTASGTTTTEGTTVTPAGGVIVNGGYVVPAGGVMTSNGWVMPASGTTYYTTPYTNGTTYYTTPYYSGSGMSYPVYNSGSSRRGLGLFRR